MIFDHIEWDERNLDHATRRLTAAEIEQAVFNADRMLTHPRDSDRGRIESVTTAARRWSSFSNWFATEYDQSPDGRHDMTENLSEAELADYYNRTRDASDFEGGEEVPITVKRNVTISVRFSPEELGDLRARAADAGVKVTSFIRAAALEATSPVDRAALGELAKELEQRAHDVATMVGRGVA